MWALATLQGHDGTVTSVAFSPGDSRTVSGSWDETVRVWDASTGEALAILQGHEDAVTSAAFSPNGSRIVSGSDDKTVRIWDASTGELLTTLQGHKKWVASVAFSPDGSRVVSRSHGKVLHWDGTIGLLLAECMDKETQVEEVNQPLFKCEHETGWLWLVDENRSSRVRLCWIPFARRPYSDCIASNRGKVAMGSTFSVVTILDCSLDSSFL
jgi:WD40 repeat protein